MDTLNISDGSKPLDFKKIWKEAVTKLGHSTIIVTGKTGVGKSTLINAVFSKDVAETGVGKPITNQIKEYSVSNFPISIIDTIGLELENFQPIKEKLIEEITNRRNDPDPNKHVNVCWYCINYGSGRIEPAEISFLDELSKFVKVIVVLTQAYDIEDSLFYNEIEKQLYNTNIKILKLVALKKYGVTPYSLDKLVAITEELLPEAQKSAFAAAQKVRIDLKVKKAHLIVAGAATSAGAVGAIPVPFSDAVALVHIQISMLAGISATMGLEFSDGFLKTLIASSLGPTAATLGGKALVTGLLKLIPGVGCIGSIISAATAAGLTTGLGEAYIKVLQTMLLNNLEITPENVSEALRNECAKK